MFLFKDTAYYVMKAARYLLWDSALNIWNDSKKLLNKRTFEKQDTFLEELYSTKDHLP